MAGSTQRVGFVYLDQQHRQSKQYQRAVSAFGGGIKASSLGTVSLTNSTVSGNSTAGYGASGGGIKAVGTVTLTNSTVSGNSAVGADANFGGIHTDALVTLINSTVTGNSATGVGGGISVLSPSSSFERITLRNSIVAGNIDNGTAPDIGGVGAAGNLMVEHSLIGDTTGSNITALTGTGNILDQPALLGTLADNGGPTQTHALLPGSPAIDAGSETHAGGLLTDQRGVPFVRVFDVPNTPGSGIDIGAYEQQFLRVVDNPVDEDDGDHSQGDLSLREAIGLANSSIGWDTITFDNRVFRGGAESLIRLTQGELVISETLTIDGSSGTEIVITG